MKRIIALIIASLLLISCMVAYAEASKFDPIQAGSDRQAVKEVQNRLIELGFLNESADGIFGKATERAILAFQLSQGLRRNGVVDEKTYAALENPKTGNASVVVEKGAPIENPNYKLISSENIHRMNLNEQNAVQNEGCFLISNGWIYGQDFDSDGRSIFVKVRTDFSDWTVLDNGLASYVNIVDNYIYYMLVSREDTGLYRMRTSGENRELIAKVYGTLQIVGDYIYYTDYLVDGEYDSTGLLGDDTYYHMYRCDLEGENTVEIINKPTFHPFVFEDGILYQDDRDNASLHICDLNGNNDIKLNDDASVFPIFDGKYIYYVGFKADDESIPATIWKIRPDGTELQQVSTASVANNMLLTKDYIYFVNADDGYRLYRIGKDGTGLTLITQDKNVAMVEFFDNYIKYTKFTDDYEYIEANYFCKYDGSGKWEFKNNDR